MKLKNFTPRTYQESIFGTAADENTLVVLPTGLGKTAIALMLAVHRLDLFPDSKIIFLSPTKPLAQQHITTFKSHIDMEGLELFTGEVSPEKRKSLWESSKIIFSTPQSIENDVLSNRISLKNVSLMVFDEAHRATGDYSYNYIAKKYEEEADFPKILALTASPGSDMDAISEICTNLFIENIEVRTEDDPDVKPYFQETKASWVEVSLPPELVQLKNVLKECIKSKMDKVKAITKFSSQYYSKGELLALQRKIQLQLMGEKDFELMRASSILAEVLKAEHAVELAESQSVAALNSYFDKLWDDSLRSKTKAIQNLVSDENFKRAYLMCKSLIEKGVEHPKIKKLDEIVDGEIKNKNKVIIFNQFRDTAVKVIEELNKISGVKAELFVGQAKKKSTGMTQKEQKEIIEKFRNDEFNVLVSTSIGEEGLDIPNVNAVIFYEPIPSAIRHIQRRGRTGRLEKGKLIVLIAKDTRDVAYRWSAHYKEKRMYKVLDELKSKRSVLLTHRPKVEKSQKTLVSFDEDKSKEEKIRIFVDAREKGSALLNALQSFGVEISIQRLDVADYLLSERIGVEYKTAKDFVDSIIDGRLLHQVKGLKDSMELPIIIIEGKDVYSQRNISPNAVRGMLTTIVGSFGIPILFSETPEESAYYIYSLAKKEAQFSKDFSMHSSKPFSLRESQEYIVSALPGIGPALAKPLLRKFGSVSALMKASVEELMMVEGIGAKKASDVRKMLDSKYEEL